MGIRRDINFVGAFVLFIFIIVLGFLLLVLDPLTGYDKVIDKSANCYDKYSNKINNVTCEKEIHCGVISKLLDKRCRENWGIK